MAKILERAAVTGITYESGFTIQVPPEDGDAMADLLINACPHMELCKHDPTGTITCLGRHEMLAWLKKYFTGTVTN